MSIAANFIKRRQAIVAGMIGAIFLGLIVALFMYMEEEMHPPANPALASKPLDIASVGSRINPQEVWVERLETENKKMSQRLTELEGFIKQQQEQANTQGIPHSDTNPSPIEAMMLDGATTADYHFTPDGETEIVTSLPSSAPKISKITLQLSAAPRPANGKGSSTVDDTLPAGVYVSSVLLSGVDASTSTTAQSDPRQVLIRMTDEGVLPRKFRSDIQDCHLVADAYGDISSERVYMRLVSLSCTERLTGEISETQVSGWVSGEDGRNGVRGIVVDRAGEVMRNTFIAGFMGGVSNFLSAQSSQNNLPLATPWGNVQQKPMPEKQMMMSGLNQGTTSALDKYADFYIKRAEQMQPVIQVAAGREVHIIFNKGTKFGETSVRKAISHVRQRTSDAIAKNISGGSIHHEE